MSRQTSFLIEFQPTKQEFAHVNFHVLFPRPLRRGAIISLLPLTAVVVSRLGRIPDSTNAVVSFLVYVGAAIVPSFLIVYAAIVWSSIRRQWRTVSALREPKTLRFSEEGVEAESATTSGFTAWQNIRRAETTRRLILLVTSVRAVIAIPISAVGGGSKLEEFRAFLKTKISDCKKL